ncbi:KTSC domain-containing protein [Streptomyces collinus]|uniref:KTSC domain-containing protein n=1 Tax=Streptomyces collinus TaxID=42684 RepID=UPI002943841A|nr:KTSC domain-containing protein [Streptomyces collinus]
MNRMPVTSSNIRSVGYDADSELLEIEFRSGIYAYSSVPEEVYRGLMEASSHGRYFAQMIKNRFDFSRIA